MHYLFVLYKNDNIDRFKDLSVDRLTEYIKNNEDKVKQYTISNTLQCRKETDYIRF